MRTRGETGLVVLCGVLLAATAVAYYFHARSRPVRLELAEIARDLAGSDERDLKWQDS